MPTGRQAYAFNLCPDSSTIIVMKKKHKKILKESALEVIMPKISDDTKKSVVAVLLLGLAVLFLLASFEKAGPVGTFMFDLLFKLFGFGYYLFPAIEILIALSLLLSRAEKFFGIIILGAIGFLLSGLGFIDIILPEKGGLIGGAIGALEIPFGYIASIVLTVCGGLASLLIALDAQIILSKPKMADDEENEEPENQPEERPYEDHQKPVIVKSPDGKKETLVLDETQPKTKNQKPEEEKEAEKIEPEIKEIGISYGTNKNKTSDKPYEPTSYVAPPLSLFKSSIEKPTSGDIRGNANIIKRTLESFGIHVEMGEINIGPKVTRYTLKPAEGIKLARILALNQDLALALAAHPIRIEAPIPGKSLVGIEVPNKSAAIVRLGTMLGFQDFASTGPLAFVLGRDVTGDPIYGDIEKMPHMLIAGATGSGKSVAIHTLILSLLYKNSPDLLKLILIDPKRVELSIYDGIPHLVSPVITEGKKSVGVFRWAISEMESRYGTLLQAGVRDIKSYNKSHVPPMPYIVIVVDELADLMAAFGREIETSIVRLAQMARATGIHLVLSTQRPSVEVITGLIKANITARMALQVASQIDSRTILDMAGAEKLLGGGDMLFTSTDFSKPKRIQGAYVSEEEIHKVSNFIMENNSLTDESKDAINNAALKIKSETTTGLETPLQKGETMFDGYLQDEDDELYDEAVKTVMEAKKASASLLQRRLSIGYARAARLIDIMEAKGVVGPGDGAKPREVFLEALSPELSEEEFKEE